MKHNLKKQIPKGVWPKITFFGSLQKFGTRDVRDVRYVRYVRDVRDVRHP